MINSLYDNVYPNNPYANRFPVECPEYLYGRDQLLERICRRLFRTKPPHSLQIVGLTRSGKTSLLKVIACLNRRNYYESFAKKFGLEQEELKRVVFVQVPCARLPTLEASAFWTLMDQQLTQALKTQANGEETPKLDCVDFECFSRKLFAIKQHFLVIFLFDGFDRVVKQAHIDISHNLRFLLEEGRGRIAYITATSCTLYDYYKDRADAKDAAPLFSYFDPAPIYLGLLEPNGARSFIKEPAAQWNVLFTEDDIAFADKKGGQHPDLTRILCKYLFENHQPPLEQRESYQTLYKRVVEEFKSCYDVVKNELSPTQLSALLRLATQGNLREVPERVRNELFDLGLIIHDGVDYHVFSSAFEHFLSEEQPSRTLSTDSGQQQLVQLAGEDAIPPMMFTVWEERRAVKVGDKLGILSPNEWKLFIYLRSHANQVCTREELIKFLSSDDADFTGAALDITISRLRQKIEYEPNKPRFIVTVRGRGYRFEGEDSGSNQQVTGSVQPRQ